MTDAQPLSTTSAAKQLPSSDIAIVGGGMVGISLALLLAQEKPDWAITLVESFPLQANADRRYQSSFDARSSALSAGSRQILDGIGLWQPLSVHVTPIRQVHVSDKGHLGGSLIDGREHGLDAVGYVVENAWFGNVLASALAAATNVTVHAPARVIKAQPTEAGYDLTLEDGGRLATALLVLADGATSQLRDSLGIAVERHDYRQTAVLANISCDRAHRGLAYERFTTEGPVALLPLGESDHSNKMVLIWTRPKDDAAELLARDDASFLESLQELFGHRAGRFVRVGTRHSYPLERSVASEQYRRALVLMGNTAHFLHPVAGQGFNLALRDCHALARVLGEAAKRGRSLGELDVLGEYMKRQELDQQLTIRMGDGFVRGFTSANPGIAALRTLGFIALDLLPSAKSLLAQQTMGLAGRGLL